ncbi:Uncharacterized protein SCF082_LOCUS6667 [Durusdinium trenchii]|uniref:Uncharacterized protein n=1 Tax=Durusdinium trenchii TaxID=1381693 RepID=A0ABP0IDZ5_9DINO
MAFLRLTMLLLCHRTLARTNRPSVQENIKNQWGYVVWGDHIDHDDYLRGMIAVANDFVCVGACGFTFDYFKELIQKQINAFTSSEQWYQVGKHFVMQLANNPGTIRDIVAGNALIKAKVDIATYNHWTDECRFCKPCTWCTPRFHCNDCGSYRVPRPNTHQPYFAFTVRARSREYTFSLTNDCHKRVSVALRYLPTGGSWTTLCWYSIGPGASITPSTNDQTLRTTNSIWYYYAETYDRDALWQGTDNTRTCRGRSLGMRKVSSVSGSKLMLRLTCNHRRLLNENQTEIVPEAEIPDQQLCLLAEDGLEGTLENDTDVKNVLAFPSHDEEEGVGGPLCTETHGLAFSEDGIAFEGLSKSRSLPGNYTEELDGEVKFSSPSCDETCAAIEESYQELKKKLEKIHGRRLSEDLI